VTSTGKTVARRETSRAAEEDDMRKLFTSVAAAACLVLSVGTVSLAASSGVSNGSFEKGTDPGSFLQVNAGDSATITGWTVVSGNVDYIGTYWKASDGHRSVDLNGSTAGSIRQSFTTIVGLTYKVSFDLSGNPAGPPTMKTLAVDVGGAPKAFSYDTTTGTTSLTNMKWARKSFTFTATATTTVLTFTSTTGNSVYGPALDDVRVFAATPDTKASCKKGEWRHWSDGRGHRFKNQGDCVSFVATHGRQHGDGGSDH
jgi:choice-of-anchor C domain-containing protein